MKKLYIVMAALLVFVLVFFFFFFSKQEKLEKPEVICKATGGAQIENVDLGETKVNFTFNATLYNDQSAKGSALWMDHEYGKTKFDVTGGSCNLDGSVSFIAEIITTNVDGFGVGDYLILQ